jgi:LuxR family quorum-sensing system transcriptional regulator SolR
MINNGLIDLITHFSIVTADKVSKIIKPFTSAFNIKHFRYLKLYNDGSRVLLSNYADCTRFYYEQGHYKKMWYDGEFPEHLIEGWHLWDMMRIINYGSEVSPFEKEINHLLHLSHGLTYIKQGIGFYEIYTFDGNSPSIYQIDKKILLHFIFFFKEQARKLISRGEQEKIIIELENPLKNYNKDKIINKFENMHINRYYLSGKYEGIYLTSKEVQCIYWLLHGKSVEEIAIIKSNSPKTIENHLDNVRNKLDCHKQTQLVRIIFESGIFSEN